MDHKTPIGTVRTRHTMTQEEIEREAQQLADIVQLSQNDTLASFVQYCTDHPELRFWQALSGWSGKTIYAGNGISFDDTFYWRGSSKEANGTSQQA